MKKLKKIILLTLIYPFMANASLLSIDMFSSIIDAGVNAANEREVQKKKLENLKSVSNAYTSCVTMNKINKIKFEGQASQLLKGLKTIDQRVKYFEVYLTAQTGFANSLAKCSEIAKEVLVK